MLSLISNIPCLQFMGTSYLIGANTQNIFSKYHPSKWETEIPLNHYMWDSETCKVLQPISSSIFINETISSGGKTSQSKPHSASSQHKVQRLDTPKKITNLKPKHILQKIKDIRMPFFWTDKIIRKSRSFRYIVLEASGCPCHLHIKIHIKSSEKET